MRNLIMCAVVLLAAVLTSSVYAAEWANPVPVQSGINTQYNDWTPYLSYDGLSLYFSRDYSGSANARIFEAKRNQPSGAFTSVSQVFSTSGHAYTPWVSPDNLRMYYHQELSNSSWQIKMSQRTSVNDPWPQGSVVQGLPSTLRCIPSLSADELAMVFNNPNVGGWDMYIATRTSKDSAFDNVRSLNELNTAGAEQRPFLSPDALSIYWGLGGQIIEATRNSLNDNFGNIQVLSVFNMPGRYNAHPAISSDGKAMYFTSGLLSGGTTDMYVSYNIPEPCTLLLLGLGAAIATRKQISKSI